VTPEKKHLHIDTPSTDQLAELVESRASTVRRLYLDTHALVVGTLPDVTYSVDTEDGMIRYGGHQYGYDGWGMAALGAYTKWVSLMFMRGVDLEDPDGLLEGTGKKMRHVKLRSLKAFGRAARGPGEDDRGRGEAQPGIGRARAPGWPVWRGRQRRAGGAASAAPRRRGHRRTTSYSRPGPGDIRRLAAILGHAALKTTVVHTEPGRPGAADVGGGGTGRADW